MGVRLSSRPGSFRPCSPWSVFAALDSDSNPARSVREVDGRGTSGARRQGVLTLGSDFNILTDREDRRLPAVPQYFVQNAHSADRSGCLR